MKNILKKSSGLLLGLSLLAGTAAAGWTLDGEQSRLNFASTKTETTSEIHSFKNLNGSISDKGTATLEIDLTSVDTGIEIRDQRMNKYFFETEKFANATATIELGEEGIKPGVHDVVAKLSLHGMEQDVPAKVMVTEKDDTLTIVTVAPVMIHSTDFGLDGGIAMLAKLAQLSSINKAVPTAFLLTFSKQ